MKHEILYAFPPSYKAYIMGNHGYMISYGKDDPTCYYTTQRVDDLEEALDFVILLGTEPERWSMDHPLNASFLSGGLDPQKEASV